MICLIKEKEIYYFEGIISGVIIQQPIGTLGFGYDSVFQPIGETHTFAQMSTQQKNRMSHRGEAIRKLVLFLGTEV